MKANGERIKQAREARGLTQEQLASRVRASQPHISLIEQNAELPSETLIEAVALATGFPASFFVRNSGPDFPLGSLLYRKARRIIPASSLAELRQVARLALEAANELGKRFKPLAITIPRVNCDPADAAQLVRSHLGLSPDSPISGLLRKIERAGVLILYLPLDLVGFDAVSAWSDEDPRRPLIFLKYVEHGDRLRRTIGHELGHLVMHQDFMGSPSDLEQEANAFAGELLFPEQSMRQEISLPLTLTRLAKLKSRWGVSMQAIAEWACDRGVISPRQKGYIRAKLAKRGWLEKEPVEIPVEFPRYLRQMIDTGFASQSEAAKALARDTSISPALLEAVLRINRPSTQGSAGMAPAGPQHKASILEFSARRSQQESPASSADSPPETGSVPS